MILGITAGGLFGDTPPAPVDAQAMIIASKLVSWWDFDNSLTDRYGVNTLTGTGTYSAGILAQKITKTSRLTQAAIANIPPMTGANPTSLSFGGWVYIVNTGGEDIEIRRTSAEAYRIAVRNANQVSFVVGATGTTTISSSVGAVTTNTYYLLTATIDGVTRAMRLYINGTQVASGTATLANMQDVQAISFGRVTGNVFTALHDDASFLCDSVLSAADVTYLYNSGAGRPGTSFPILPRNAWTWFNDPRCIEMPGGRILTGGVNSDNGAIQLNWTDDSGATFSTFDLLGSGTVDDHDNPGLLRRSDNHIMAMFCRHNGSQMYVSTSDNPGDPSAFTRVDIDSQLGGGPYAYANPYQLTGEANDPIYLFYRSGTTPTWSAYYSVSINGGTTWAAQTRLLDGDPTEGRPYLKCAQNGNDRIDFACTDGNPAEVPTNSIYHFYYQGGSWYTSAGVSMGTPPFTVATEPTEVYDGTTVRSWIWDIQIDETTGYPVIVFATFPTTSDHRYNYARWNGSSWDVNEICAAGTGLYAAEPYYSGGVCIDPDDVNTVYASREASGVWTLYKYVTANGGASFTETAFSTCEDAIRPYKIKGASLLAAVAGPYTTYNSFKTRTVLFGT